MRRFETGKMNSKGVVAIPVKLRKMLGADEGDKLEFIQVGDDFIVRALKEPSVWDAFGILDLNSPLVDVREHREEYRQEIFGGSRHENEERSE